MLLIYEAILTVPLYQVIAYCKLLDTEQKKENFFKEALLAVPVTDKDYEYDKWGDWLEKSPRLKLNDITVYVLPCPVPQKAVKL